jgi:hypothetical protein
MCVSRSIELEAAATKTPESKPFDISNDEQQKEKHTAHQFFSSLLNNLFILSKLAERVGFESTQKRSFNNIERTAGNVKHWKALVSSANGSQTDHGSVIN